MLSIAKALELLGPTESSVVAALRCLGIKGNRMDGCSCPIKQYLSKVTSAKDIKVRSFDITLDDSSDPAFAQPEAVRRFIFNFDHGLYGDLIQRNTIS